jgi:hypothetical protein
VVSQGGLADVEAEAGFTLAFVGTVATETVFGQDREDIAPEADGFRRLEPATGQERKDERGWNPASMHDDKSVARFRDQNMQKTPECRVKLKLSPGIKTKLNGDLDAVTTTSGMFIGAGHEPFEVVGKVSGKVSELTARTSCPVFEAFEAVGVVL